MTFVWEFSDVLLYDWKQQDVFYIYGFYFQILHWQFALEIMHNNRVVTLTIPVDICTRRNFMSLYSETPICMPTNTPVAANSP